MIATHMEQSTTYKVNITKLPNSQVEIKATIPAEEFDGARNEAIKHIGADIELPGFRKGHVPEKMLIQKIGEVAILEEMAEIVIGKTYPKIIAQEKLDVLGRPTVTIQKIALGNPLEFTIVSAIFPEITLADYKKIAAKEMSKKETIEVSEEDMAKTLEQIQRMRATNDAKKEGKEPTEDAELPTLDDEYVKTLGDFTSVEDFKAKLKENIQKEKERESQDKKRVTIMEAIAEDSTIELPEIIVEQELARMEDEFSHDITRMGMTFDDYLKAIKKTREDMVKDWRPDAEKRAKTQLITAKIAELENLSPDEEAMKKESAILKQHYPDAPEDRVQGFVHMILTNQKVFAFLESQK
ncbi:MAG: hypothetical protein A2494_00340 [Candidatus Lloydbacteria bacterium RIFOXYC12_FULL_46_25]|uniref:Trigger factor n=1 Tax=Candidatus Lloydbacteria bacterium RIFOXYC12_FULL_46_25 TaxID=1798670 RepID=A0A1G2DUF7_9BACT|nr:MAG: hypothetical protein A2494_00340 [Candidatus Lloydbacteria bacterium RIFOXYC12_FULL_46_25]